MVAAFVAGLLSFLSPCVLPLVPGYLSLISGASMEQLQSRDRKMLKTVMLHSILFIVGFSVVFVSLGAAASEFGQLVKNHKKLLTWVAGIIIIIFGIHLTGLVKIKAFYADKRLHSVQGGKSPLGAFLVGFAFAFGWTPCIGPLLGSVMGMAASSATLGAGILLLCAYSIGLAVPFLLISVAFDQFLAFYGRFRRHLHTVEILSGVLLITLGILVLTGRLTLLSEWLGAHDHATQVLEVVLVIVMAAGLLSFIYTRLSNWLRKGGQFGRSEKNTVALVAVMIVVITGLLFAGKRLVPSPANVARASADDDRFNGKAAPDFELNVLDGNNKKLKLSSLKGKAVVVNFWATWCEPCKIEMPWLVDLQKKYGADGLQIVGIAMDDTDEKTITSFTRKMGVNYPVLQGTEAVADLYGGIDGLPTLFFVDRSGKIVEHELGLRDLSNIEDNIKKCLSSTDFGKVAVK
ncbi:MAG TPA: cytochrome c biogenesis protein CcdA [Candidatus Angelobacter sp.]